MNEIKEKEILANHSTFRIGGPAKYFVVVKSKEELAEAIEFAKGKGLPFFILGGGSNILFRDEGYKGLVIKLQIANYRLLIAGVIADAGLPFSQLIMKSIDAGLAGLEWGMGIPGTVGGAVAGNAGAYGHSISEFVKSVTVLDEGGNIKKYSNEECEFAYRGSGFKGSPPRRTEIVLEIEFNLEKGDKEKSKKMIREILESRKGKIVPYPSAGSVFKNIIIDEVENEDEFLKLIPREKIKGGKFPTAWLVEDCGLKGRQIGGAKFADEHANFIVNAGGARPPSKASGVAGAAKASDVLKLIELCKQKVREKFNIDLEEEIVVI